MEPAGAHRVFVVSAPSGAGKSTLVQRLLRVRDDVRLSVSHTTRKPRPGEEDGVAYHFVDEPSFRARMAEGAFLEWAEVHGNLYGTARAEIERIHRAGCHALCDVDVQGGAAIRDALADAISIFVVPPSMEELSRRLRGRGTEDEAALRRRLGNALGELAHAPDYDYVVVNDALDEAVADLLALLRAAPLATRYRRAIVEELMGRTS